MKNEKLYEAITNLSDETINEAQDHQLKRKAPAYRKWGALAACLCIAIVGGIYGINQGGIPGGSSGSGNAGGGTTYMSYQGPVFPLTFEQPVSGLTAQRNVDFDFAPYKTATKTSKNDDGTIDSYDYYAEQTVVADSYTLTNTTNEDLTLTGVYPFAASFSNTPDALPAVTVNGAQAKTTLHPGPYSASELSNWEAYKALLAEGQYMARAFDAWPELSQPVIVYELYDPIADFAQGTNPTLNMEFTIDYSKTTILSYGMNGGTQDLETGFCARQFSVPQQTHSGWGDSRYLIVLGEDIGEYVLQGYADGGTTIGNELDSVSAKVKRYETTLGEIVQTTLGEYIDSYGGDSLLSGDITQETLLGATAQLMHDCGILSNDVDNHDLLEGLEDIFSQVSHLQRVMYLTFEVTIPAGESATVNANMVKAASRDFVGDNKDRNGYDMVTALGSNLHFTAQTASIQDHGVIELLDQNFGFDIKSGIKSATLDPSTEHYFMDVRKIK